MIEIAERGPDIVAGWRKDRKDPFLSRRLPSMIANAVISFSTGVKLHDYGCSLKVFRAEVVKPMKLYGEMHRFLPAIASEIGATIVETVVNHRARRHGTSNYGISRTVRVVLDLLTVKFLISYSTRPLHIFGLLGFVMGLLGTLVCGWLAYQSAASDMNRSADRPLLLLGILLIFTGVQLVTLGPARGNAGADVSRVAGQAHLRHPRDSRNRVLGRRPGARCVALTRRVVAASLGCAALRRC